MITPCVVLFLFPMLAIIFSPLDYRYGWVGVDTLESLRQATEVYTEGLEQVRHSRTSRLAPLAHHKSHKKGCSRGISSLYHELVCVHNCHVQRQKGNARGVQPCDTWYNILILHRQPTVGVVCIDGNSQPQWAMGSKLAYYRASHQCFNC